MKRYGVGDHVCHSPIQTLCSDEIYQAMKRAARRAAAKRGARVMPHYDSDATPCGCVLSGEHGAVPVTIVIARPYRNRTALCCQWCDCEWYEPEPPYRGLNPGPDGLRVIRQGAA